MPSAEYQKKRRDAIKKGNWELREFLDEVKTPSVFEKYAEVDSTGIRFRSEVKPYLELQQIFFGIKLSDDEDKDEKDAKYKHKKAKKALINPSTSKFLGEKLTFEMWLEFRDKARKDLFWLAKDILKKDLTENTHRVVCDMFIKKNFDGAFPAGYTIGDVHKAIGRQQRFDAQGRYTKDMMLIDPRGFFKSTIDGIDCVQWLINAPDIRILILTGEYKFAVALMKEIKGYFYLAEGAEPSDFQILFPEYILLGVDGTSTQPLECPVRKHTQVAASLWVNSIDSNLSGWHCDIRKGDDVVTDENCNSELARSGLKDKFDGTENLLDEWGFSDFIGTRYFTDDWYASRIAIMDDAPLAYHCRAAWTVKPEYIEVPLRDLTKDMVILAFPEKATFASLRKKLLTNEKSFRNQQLNQPSDANEDSAFKIAFEEDILKAHVYQPSAVPREGDIFVTWDWAPSNGKQSDMSVGVAGRITKKEVIQIDGTIETVYGLAILEIIFNRWKPSELALQIVAFNKKWNPKQTLIERSQGAELLQMEVARQAVRYGTTLNIYWKPISMQSDAKRNRIKGLETLLAMDRLYFVAGPWLEETFYQFIRYTGERKNRGRKDDIPDAISMMVFFLPSTVMNEDLKKKNEADDKQRMLKANYERMFGGSQAYVPTPSTAASESPLRGRFGIPGLRS